MHKHHLISSTALCTLFFASSLAVQAQAAPAGKQAATPTETIETVVVTAQRRSENLERTPVSVTVISGSTLADAQILTQNDLHVVAPGLIIRAGQNSNELSYSLRGQSLDVFSDSRPSVLPYINDVQVGGTDGESAFFDLASVQVLKGPQGTLFGRSTTGGAVLFTTQKPTGAFGGYVSAALGDYASRKFEGAINFPVVADKVLLRLSGLYQERRGYQYNMFTHDSLGGFKRYGLRLSLTWKPTDAITNNLMVQYDKVVGSNQLEILYNFGLPYDPASPGNAYPFAAVPMAYIFGPGSPFLLPGQSDIVSQLVAQKARGPYVVNTSYPDYYKSSGGNDYYKTNATTLTNTTTFDLNSDTQIKNIFGFASSWTPLNTDLTALTFALDGAYDLYDSSQVSEEVQLLGKTFDERLTYVIGGFFAHDDEQVQIRSFIIPQFFLLAYGIPNYHQTNHYERTDRTLAVYAQGTYDLSEVTGLRGLSFTLGGRYNNEKVDNRIFPDDVSYVGADSSFGHVFGPGFCAGNPSCAAYQSKTNDTINWTVGLQEQLDPDLMLYVVSRRGTRGGGYNGINAPLVGVAGVNGGNAFLTERLTDVEVGEKFQGMIASWPARVNIDAYHDWISDAQHVAYTIGAAGAPAAITVNVPRAVVQGVEFDGEVAPIDWLKVGASVNYTDAKFTSALVKGVLFGPYPDTPVWTGSIFADVTVPLTDNIYLTLHSDAYQQTKMWYVSAGNVNRGGSVPGYTIADFRVGLFDDKYGWSLIANVKNAFDKVYYMGGNGVAELFQENAVEPGSPRTFMVEARYTF